MQVHSAHLVGVEIVAQSPQGGGFAAARLAGEQADGPGVDQVAQTAVELFEPLRPKQRVGGEGAVEGRPGEAEGGWGTPQGAVISPLLSNIYLDPLDHHMARFGYEMVRYADDFVILCQSQLEAQWALIMVEEWVTAAGLQLHPDKTRIVDASQRGGFDFLGYHFERGLRWPSAKSRRKFQDKIRSKTGRTNGHSLQRIIADLVSIQRGWFEYFKHSHWSTFEQLDKWIRMRLRSILRHRQKRKGRSRGRDHNRWPKTFFAELGLYSFYAAYAQTRQPSRR